MADFETLSQMVCLFPWSALLRVRTAQPRHAKPFALPARGEKILFMNSPEVTFNQIKALWDYVKYVRAPEWRGELFKDREHLAGMS